MKRITLILWLLLSTTVWTFAYDFQSGDLYYNITSDSTAEVTNETFDYNHYLWLTSVVIPESVTYNGTTYRVTKIGQSAFEDCSDFLTSVTIPNSVTSIGKYAFYRCSSLTSITIPNSVTSIGDAAFEDCSGLTSVTIGNSVTSIGAWAFYGCNGLTSIIIPNSVTSIGSGAFYKCSGLTSVTIGNSVTEIGRSAFKYCSGLTSVTIPNGITSIEMSAFEYCSGLTSITIPNGVTSIGDGAFSDCSGLTSITIPNGVTSIGDGAFSDCSGLTSVAIPNNVTSIGGSTFHGCSSLTSVIIPNSVTSIGEYAFYECSGLTSVTIPNSVTCIGDGAFFNCSGLMSITVENGNKVYDSRNNCNAIIETATNTLIAGCQNTIIPNSVTRIELGAFHDCIGLTSVTIPNSVTWIMAFAFSGCSGLMSVTCYATEPPAIDYETFDMLKDYSISQSLYVPDGSVEKYKAAEIWKYFKEILPISAMPADVDEPVINPEENRVTITWPATDKAATYTIEISKDGAPVCTLTFDANGVLKNMRFAAPSRHAAQHTTQAEATGSGFRFVVEGLDSATTYAYTITATDIDNAVLSAYTGFFTTTGDNPTTDTEDIRSAQSHPETRKVFRNGQMYIIRGEETYTATGGQL